MGRRTISIRDLQNHGDELIARVLNGESLTITRSGTPVAELGPVRRRGLDREILLRRWRRLPPVDPEAFRRQLDATLDSSL